MSDYFTFPKQDSGDVTKQSGTPCSTRNSSRNLELPKNYRSFGGSNDELASMYSGDSQYLMDMIPDSLTLRNVPTFGSPANLSPSDGPDAKDGSDVKLDDYILPKSDLRSPYHVNVPIPKKAPKGEGKVKIKPKAKDKAETSDLEAESAFEDSPEFVREFPTDILVDRFHKWKKILKSLIAYFREAAYSQEQIARINYQLKNSVKFAFLTDLEEGSNKLVDPTVSKVPAKKPQPVPLALKKNDNKLQLDVEEPQPVQPELPEQVTSASSGFMKFGSGSIQDIQVILKKYHLSLGNQQYKISKEIVASLVPKLAGLRKDLSAKIKEIKELNGDFRTNIGEHVKITSRLLNKYIASVKFVDRTCDADNKQKEKLKPKHDPYLLKLQLDLQLKRQLLEENYLQEAFVNLQTAALQLEKIVYSKIQCALQRYSALIDSEARLMIKNVCHELQQGILSRPPALEWDNFVAHHPTCLMNLKSNDPLPQPRKLSDIVYPNMKSPLAKCIRVGYLFKRSESSKGFTKGYFVLTTNYLHEFKSSDFFLENKPLRSKNKATEYSSNSSADKNGTANGNQPSSNGTQDLKLTKTRKGMTSSNLYPVSSLSLNDCSFIESTDMIFTLRGYANYHFSEDPSLTTDSSAVSNASTLSTKKNKHQRTPSTLSIVSVPKFLKGSSKSKEQKKVKGNSSETKDSSINNKTNKDKNVEWTFKICFASSEPTPEELKTFKKWVQDMKSLTSFNNTLERSNFIEEKVLKSRSYNSGKNSQSSKLTTATTAVESFVNLSEKATPSSSVYMLNTKRANRPRYIDINGANTNAGAMNSVYRSKVNTPAIDDNGNLAIVGERKNSAPQNAMSSAFIMPSSSPHSPRSGTHNLYHHSADNLAASPTQKVSPFGEVPQVAVTSHGTEAIISASAYSDDSYKSSRASSVPSIVNQRRTSLPSLLKNVPGSSPSCVPLDGNANGYFGIPLNCNSESRRGSELSAFENQSPLYEEGRSQNCSNSRRSSAGYMPQQYPPKVKLNDSELNHTNPGMSQSNPDSNHSPKFKDIKPPYNSLKKTSSAGNVPLVRTESNEKPFYSNKNRSSNSVSVSKNEATKTHPIRTHRKNISFGSLNSVMNNKKNSSQASEKSRRTSSTGIEEADEEEDHIKLNQSLYS